MAVNISFCRILIWIDENNSHIISDSQLDIFGEEPHNSVSLSGKEDVEERGEQDFSEIYRSMSHSTSVKYIWTWFTQLQWKKEEV